MHHVGKFEPDKLDIPAGYHGRSKGFRSAPLVNRNVGSVHMGLAICELEPGGSVEYHSQSNEEGFYVLEGQVLLGRDRLAYALTEGDYGVIPTGASHSWRNTATGPVRWLEMVAPQPKTTDRGVDTFWEGEAAPETARPPDWRDPRLRHLGHFSEEQLPRASQIQMDGYRGGNIAGISLKMLIDGFLGAQHLTMFIVQFEPGGAGNVHDHPFEESYFFLSGEAEAVLDGKTYRVGPGGYVWTGVGGTHGFFNKGAAPVRWLETQAPQPPTQHAFRFWQDWEGYLASKLGQQP